MVKKVKKKEEQREFIVKILFDYFNYSIDIITPKKIAFLYIVHAHTNILRVDREITPTLAK